MSKARSLGPVAPKYCFTAWSFRGPAEDVDVARILSELEEQGAVVAEVIVKDVALLLVHDSVINDLVDYERNPGTQLSNPPNGFRFRSGVVRESGCYLPSTWSVMSGTTPQELVEWIERASDKKRAGVRTVVRAYKP
jgi:hypothetical protein